MSHHRHTLRDAIVDAQAKEAGWPMPEREFAFAPPRKWRADYFWPRSTVAIGMEGGGWFLNARVALEIEGGVFTGGRHTRGVGFLKDCEKYNTMAAMGIRLIRLTPKQLENGELAAWLRRMAA